MNRIDELLIRDKFTNLESIAEVLKEEITPIARNFLLMSDELKVRYKRNGDKFVFNVEIEADRIKPFGNRLI